MTRDEFVEWFDQEMSPFSSKWQKPSHLAADCIERAVRERDMQWVKMMRRHVRGDLYLFQVSLEQIEGWIADPIALQLVHVNRMPWSAAAGKDEKL